MRDEPERPVPFLAFLCAPLKVLKAVLQTVEAGGKVAGRVLQLPDFAGDAFGDRLEGAEQQ